MTVSKVADPLHYGKILWDCYGLPAIAYAWEILPVSETQLKELDTLHRNFKRASLRLSQHSRIKIMDSIDMGLPPSLHYEKARMNYLWYIKSLPDDRWGRRCWAEMESWVLKDIQNKNWLAVTYKILSKHGIPTEAQWSKYEQKHYWNIRRERHFQSLNNHPLRIFDKFDHRKWLQFIAGDMKLFGPDFSDCPFCNQVDIIHWWDHVVLHCEAILSQTVTCS